MYMCVCIYNIYVVIYIIYIFTLPKLSLWVFDTIWLKPVPTYDCSVHLNRSFQYSAFCLFVILPISELSKTVKIQHYLWCLVDRVD